MEHSLRVFYMMNGMHIVAMPVGDLEAAGSITIKDAVAAVIQPAQNPNRGRYDPASGNRQVPRDAGNNAAGQSGYRGYCRLERSCGS